MEIRDILKEIGLSEKESSVYIESLQLGPESILTLSKATKIHRPMLYKLLEEMLEKGVMKTTLNKSRTEYMAVEPQGLVNLLDTKRRLLENALPELAALSAVGKKDVKILYYHGRKQLQELFRTGLLSKSEILSFFPSRYMAELFGKREMEEIIKQRIERKIPSKTLRSVESDIEFEGSEENYKAFREVRHLPDNAPLKMGIVIFDDKVNLFSPIEEDFGVQIKSQAYADLMRFMFLGIWTNSK